MAVFLGLGVKSLLAFAQPRPTQQDRTGESESLIPPQEFLDSQFAELFKAGRYPEALEALATLLARAPNDPLVLRYQAMTLDRLGRSQEAIAIYHALLARNPDHSPTHVFLGEAYERIGRWDLAVKEWRWVVERGVTTEYRYQALAALARAATRPPLPVRPGRWILLGDLGWDWDSNVAVKPSDKGAASSSDQNAGRWSLNGGVICRAFVRPDAEVDVGYVARQSLHDGNQADFNFTSQEFNLDAKRRLRVAGRELLFGGFYEVLAGWLEGELFSLVNRATASADSRLTPHTRTIISNRFAVSAFGPDGSNPPQTSRDGLSNDLALTQYWYTADFRHALFVRQEFNITWTRGGNFERRGATTRAGLHATLPWRVSADVSGGFQWSRYPRFTSLSALEPQRRRDTTWETAASVTYHVSSQVALRLQYLWIHAVNPNDLFQYDRQIAGTHLEFVRTF